MSGETGRLSASQVADEAEDTRAHLASTLQQLRDNLRPENVVEEVVSNAKVGASAVADNLVEVAKANPLPVILIAAGAAVVMGVMARMRGGGSRVGASGGSRPSTLSNPTSFGSTPHRETRGSGLGSVAASLKNDVRDLVSDGRSQLSAGMDGLKRQAADAYQSTSSNARDAMQNVSRYIPSDRSEVKSKLATLLEEQPLVLGAIGLAVGAAIGAALPITETEDSLMGGVSHQVRQAASDVARHEVDGLKAAAGEVVENVKKSAADHGLSKDNLNDLVKDVGAQARAAVDKVGSSQDV